MKILIIGDSFSTDWSVKYDCKGWPNLLAKKYEVTNLSQAGVSEYKIYKQIENIEIKKFDRIIISHTSPYRIYTKINPFTKNDLLHYNSDLVLNDVYSRKGIKSILIKYFIKYHFDKEYYLDTYNCWFDKLNQFPNALHIKHLDIPIDVDIDFFKLWQNNKGLINHYNNFGNQYIFQKLDAHLTN